MDEFELLSHMRRHFKLHRSKLALLREIFDAHARLVTEKPDLALGVEPDGVSTAASSHHELGVLVERNVDLFRRVLVLPGAVACLAVPATAPRVHPQLSVLVLVTPYGN
jgi:hypothetical protein